MTFKNPNEYPFGVLQCGYVVSMHGILHADRKWWQHCPFHRKAEVIKKFKASPADILAWQDKKRQGVLF